jgi:putative hydrolase of HD superfamily
LLPFLTYVNDLKRLPRTGWLLAGVPAAESVAEHTLATTFVALVLAETINTDWAAASLTQPLEIARILRIALVHDLAESLF